MRAMGIALQKNFMRYSILEGSKAKPSLISKGRLPTTDPDEIPALMDWFETQFDLLIKQYKPECIGYKLSLEPNLEQMHTLTFPIGVLNLIANKNQINICEYSTKGITPSKLSLPKGTDLYNLVDNEFGNNPPYWDSVQKDSILVGWFCL